MNKYKIGFWNYVETGTLNAAEAAEDWKELGFNMPMSFDYDPAKHRKEQMLEQLDACAQRGMQLIVCDARTSFHRYIAVGEKEYCKGVRDAAADFATHPAFGGFHVGDEPCKDQWRQAERAYIICKDAAPKSVPFINFLPYWDEDNFYDSLGVENEKYGELLDSFLKKTGAKRFGYDYYGQCAYFEKERYRNVYFRNLRIFSDAAKKNGAELIVSLLSVGHWSLRVPDEDLLRWQIATAVGHGATGLLWFFVYERRLDSSFRLSPVDLFWNRTETFGRLSRQNRTFQTYFAEKLSNLTFDGVTHFYKQYGGYAAFVPNAELQEIVPVVNPAPVSVARFTDKTGRAAYLLVNLLQDEPTCLDLRFGGYLQKNSGRIWFAPGQMYLFSGEESREQ